VTKNLPIADTAAVFGEEAKDQRRQSDVYTLKQRTAAAANRSWPVVRGNSTSFKPGARGIPVSRCAKSTILSRCASMPLA